MIAEPLPAGLDARLVDLARALAADVLPAPAAMGDPIDMILAVLRGTAEACREEGFDEAQAFAMAEGAGCIRADRLITVRGLARP